MKPLFWEQETEGDFHLVVAKVAFEDENAIFEIGDGEGVHLFSAIKPS